MNKIKQFFFILGVVVSLVKPYCFSVAWTFKPVTKPNEKAQMAGPTPIVDFGNVSTSIKVSGTSKLYTMPIAMVYGTIDKATTDALQGEFWFLDDGVLKNNGTGFAINGWYTGADSPEILLQSSNDFLSADRGEVVETVVISGGGTITGQPIFSNTITLSLRAVDTGEESYVYYPSLLTLGIQSNLNKNIVFNSGTIFLEDDLRLADDVIFDGSGTVSLNGYKIIFGGKDLSWSGNLYWHDAATLELNSTQTLSGRWIFDGNAHIVGNNHVIDLSSGGTIIVETAGTFLLLDNVIIKGLSGTNIRCLENSCTISLRNVRLILNDDYTFDKGCIAISDKVVIEGQHSYKYMTNRQSIISADSCLALEPDTIFHYEPSIAEKDLISMTDQTAEIFLNSATLLTSTTGLQLTKGTLMVDGKSFLRNDEAQGLSEGFVIGDGTSEGEVTIDIKPGATLDLVSGCLDYKNI